MNKEFISPKTIKALKIIFLNLLFVILLYYVIKVFENSNVDFRDFLNFSPLEMGISAFFFILFYITLSIGWILTLGLYTNNNNPKSVFAFFSSQIFKYMPSSIFSFSSRVYFAHKLGSSTSCALNAIIIENALMISSAFIVYIALTMNSIYTAILILGIILLYCLYRYLNSKISAPIIKKFLPPRLISFSRYIFLWLIYFISWIIAGLSLEYFLLSTNISSIGLSTIIAFQSLSYALSILAIFAPGGIGVREFVLLSAKIPQPIIIYWRAFTFCLDVIVSVISLILQYFVKRSKKL